MAAKHPSWTRSRAGRNRVHWVAYDDRPGSEGCQIIDQGYAEDLHKADLAARTALANAGHYQARRVSSIARATALAKPERSARPDSIRPERPRDYLYTRMVGEGGEILVAAHLILKKTARRIYVSRNSCGPDQLGSEDERWAENEAALSLDRLKLERDGSVYSSGHRLSDFFRTRDAAEGDAAGRTGSAFRQLGIRPPASVEDIKAAYRRKAFQAHPDRGGDPVEFQEVEAAYRLLLRQALGSN
jgi:hypothetical protein